MIPKDIPRQIHFDEPEQHNKPFRITWRTANNIKYGLILGVLLTTFYAVSNFNPTNYMGFFGTQAFMHVAISYVIIYLLWQWINNRFSKFPVEITKSSNGKRTRQLRLQKNPDRKSMLFIMIGYTLSLAFSLMVMIYLAVAHLSGTGETHLIWNHFGEMTIETALFVCAFIVIVVGYCFTYKTFKQMVRKVVK